MVFHRVKTAALVTAIAMTTCTAAGAMAKSTVSAMPAHTATSLQMAAPQIASKTLTIYNHYDHPIYPVLETSMHPAGNPDKWLASYLPQLHLKAEGDGGSESKIFHVYLAGEDQSGNAKPVLPGETLKVAVPFFTYSQLLKSHKTHEQTVSNPIDFWNGMRLFIYDNSDAVATMKLHEKAVANESLDGNARIFAASNNAAAPVADPYQLIEYTFGTEDGDLGPMGFDISYVDSAYMPVAIEDEEGSKGYSGWWAPNPNQPADYSSVLSEFQRHLHWPVFAYSPVMTGLQKLQSPYNAIVNSSDMQQYFLNKWQHWLTMTPKACEADSDPDMCTAYRQQTQALWRAAGGNSSGKLDSANVGALEKIYGFTGLPARILVNPVVPPNASTPSVPAYFDIASVELLRDLEAGVPYPAYKYTDKAYPDYDSVYALNPYVSLIHKKLNMAIGYAYSVDDDRGYIAVDKSAGLRIVVGGGVKAKDFSSDFKNTNEQQAKPWASPILVNPGPNNGYNHVDVQDANHHTYYSTDDLSTGVYIDKFPSWVIVKGPHIADTSIYVPKQAETDVAFDASQYQPDIQSGKYCQGTACSQINVAPQGGDNLGYALLLPAK